MERIFLLVVVIILLVFLSAMASVGMKKKKKPTEIWTYTKKTLMTKTEMRYFEMIQKAAEGYNVVPQVNLAAILQKHGDFKYQNELFRNIDFGVFDEHYNVVILIEINDPSHNRKDRQERDEKVRNLCESVGIPLVEFWTKDKHKQKDVDEELSFYL